MDLAVAHPRLAPLYRYWCAKADLRRPPRRRDIDPLDLRFCLGYLALAEIEQPFRVRYRLVGTKLVELYGSDLTGHYVDELYAPHFRDRMLQLYRRVADTAEPHYDEPFFGSFRHTLAYHRLLLPLSSDGGCVDLVLVGICPSDPTLANAGQWRSLDQLQDWLADESQAPFLRAWADDADREATGR